MKTLTTPEENEKERIQALIDFFESFIQLSREDSPRIWAAAVTRLQGDIYYKSGIPYDQYAESLLEASKFYICLWERDEV